jgi:phosphoribosyl 1,2-cyclic phosphodiesterase
MKIRFLGAHMFESKETRLSCILIDGVMAVDAGALTSALSFKEQEAVEYVLLTHGHYDHIRDLPTFALRNENRTVTVVATSFTLELLTTHWLNGTVYPDLTRRPSAKNPALRLQPIEPFQPLPVGPYEITAIPVNHAIPSVGFKIAAGGGAKTIFFTGDTGPGLDPCWKHVNPQVLIVDTAFSNRAQMLAAKPGHLCPILLREELLAFRKQKGHFPYVVLTHLNPEMEPEIREESRALAVELGIKIQPAYEGLEVIL